MSGGVVAVFQLASIYKASAPSTNAHPSVFDGTDCHMRTVFDHLASLLTTQITLDDIIANQSTLSDHWSAFKRVLNNQGSFLGSVPVPFQKLPKFTKLKSFAITILSP